MAARAPLHVAAAVIRDAGGRILLARRPDHLHQGGLWEFPGGKLDEGEPVADALVRELAEELGIGATRYHPLICIDHVYADRHVLLDVWEVTAYHGAPRPLEGQTLQWAAIGTLDQYDFPAADVPVLTSLRLPRRITVAPGLSGRGTALRLAPGEPSLTSHEADDDGLSGWHGRSCNTHADVTRAREEGCDFILLDDRKHSPAGLAALLRHAGLPVYVTGQASGTALSRIRRLGGHGIAVTG